MDADELDELSEYEVADEGRAATARRLSRLRDLTVDPAKVPALTEQISRLEEGLYRRKPDPEPQEPAPAVQADDGASRCLTCSYLPWACPQIPGTPGHGTQRKERRDQSD